jgi:hypothetical protein
MKKGIIAKQFNVKKNGDLPGFLVLLAGILLIFAGCQASRYPGIVSWSEYNIQTRLNPYVLELEASQGSLFYYGVFHSQDTGDKQFRVIEDKWKQFQPDVVFCEGGIWPLELSRELSISKHGEPGFLRYLSSRDRIKLKSLEPRRIQEAIYLSKIFSIPKIKTFYILRQAVLNRIQNKGMNEKHVARILSYFEKPPFSNTSPVNVKQFEHYVRKLFPQLDNWRQVPEIWFYSCPKQSWLPRMFRQVNDFRNHIMIRKILREVKRGKRVFAVVGRSHVVRQEPVLRSKIYDL